MGWRRSEARFEFVRRSAVAPIRQPVLLLFAHCEMEESLEWSGRLERCASSTVFARRAAIEVFHQMITVFWPLTLPLPRGASAMNAPKKRNSRSNRGYQSLDSFYCRYEYCFSFSASEFSFERFFPSLLPAGVCMHAANASFIRNSVRAANMEILDEYRLREEYSPTSTFHWPVLKVTLLADCESNRSANNVRLIIDLLDLITFVAAPPLRFLFCPICDKFETELHNNPS